MVRARGRVRARARVSVRVRGRVGGPCDEALTSCAMP